MWKMNLLFRLQAVNAREMGGVSPIGLVQKNSVPVKSPLPEELIKSQAWILDRPVALLSGCNQMFDKAVDVRVPGEEVPVEPADLIVLAIRVIIALSGSFSSRHPSGAWVCRTRSTVIVRKFFTCRLRSFSMSGSSVGPFDAAVPAQVVVAAIPVVLAVSLVVFVVVRDQIIERESVVAGDKIDALLRLALFVAIDVGACQAVGMAKLKNTLFCRP